tara:strand:- start:762 stop:7328 length:6567 start_codon:yes stop_codon:yes gene_type:complete
MPDYKFDGVTYSEDEIAKAAGNLNLSLEDYLKKYPDVTVVNTETDSNFAEDFTTPIPEGAIQEFKEEKEGYEGYRDRLGENFAFHLNAFKAGLRVVPGIREVSSFMPIEGIIEAAEPAYREAKLNSIIFKRLYGKTKDEISDEDFQVFLQAGKKYSESLEGMKAFNRWSDEYDKVVENGGNPFEATLLATAREGTTGLASQVFKSIAGSLLSTGEEGLDIITGQESADTGITDAAAGAGLAVALGQVGPLSVLPEEIVSIPLMSFAGYSKGSAEYMEKMLSYYSQIQEVLAEDNKEMTLENIRELFNDEAKIKNIERKAALRGETIGWVEGIGSLIGFGAARRISAATRKNLFGSTSKTVKAFGGSKGVSTITGLGTGSAVEMGAGSLGETLGLIAEEKPLDAKEIILEGISGPFSAAPVQVLNQITSQGSFKKSIFKINGEVVSEEKIKEYLEIAPEDIGDMNLEAENDPFVEKLISEQQIKAGLSAEINARVTDPADRAALLELEFEKLKYLNSKTTMGKNTLKSIQSEIDVIADKYAKVGRKSKATLDIESKQQKLKQDIGKRNIAATKRFVETQGKTFGLETEVYADEKAILKRLKELGVSKKNINKYSKASDEVGGFIIGKKIFINEDVASKTEQVNVGGHELLHGILNNVIGNSKEQAELVAKFKKVLTKKQRDKVQERLNDNYEVESHDREYITAFSDLIRDKEISFDDGVMNRLGNIIADVFRFAGFKKISFKDGRGVYNFLREYNRGIEKGELSESITSLFDPSKVPSNRELVESKKKAEKTPEKSLQELAEEYQAENSENVVDFVNQYYRFGLSMMGYDISKKDLVGVDRAKGFLTDVFNSILTNYKQTDPETGAKQKFTTYAGDIIRKRGKGFFKAELSKLEGRISLSDERTKELKNIESEIEEVVPTIDPILDIITFDENLTVEEQNELIQEIENEYAANLDKVDLTNYKTAKDASPSTTQKIFGETAEQELKTFEEKAETIYNLFPENQRRLTIKGSTKSATGLKPVIRNNFYVKGDRADMTAGTAAGNPIQAKIPFDKFIPSIDKFDSKDHGKTIEDKFGELSGTKGPKNRNQKTFRDAVKAEIGKAITLYVARKRESNQEIINQMADGKSPMSFARKSKITIAKSKKGEAMFSNDTKLTNKQIFDKYVGKGWYEITDRKGIEKYIADVKTILEVGNWPEGFWGTDMWSRGPHLQSLGRTDKDYLRAELKKIEGLKPLRGDDRYAKIKPSTEFGKKGKEVRKNATKSKVKKYNDRNLNNFDTMWNEIVKVVRENPKLSVAFFHMLENTQKNLNHYHRLGAELLYIDSKTNEDVVFEHALTQVSAFRYLMDSALDKKRNWASDFKALKDNYKLIAVSKVNNEMLGKAGLSQQMSIEDAWNISKDYWWQRYFNYVVSQIADNDGNFGINPNNLINPQTGKTLMQELNVDINGEVINEGVFNQQQKSMDFSRRKKKPAMTKAQKLDNQVEAIINKKYSGKNLSVELNRILQEKKGIPTRQKVQKAEAILKGEQAQKDVSFFRKLFIYPEARDFAGLMYSFFGKAREGEAQKAWFKRNFDDPFNAAMNKLSTARVAMLEDFKALMNQLPTIKPKRNKFGIKTSPLSEKIEEGSIYTKEHAVRVFMWTKEKMEIPGISKKDLKKLLKHVKDNPELEIFANKILQLKRSEKYIKPDESWIAGTVKSDLLQNLSDTTRAELLKEWNKNIKETFNENNLNKIESLYGKDFRVALEDSIRRMRTGINRRENAPKYITEFTDWWSNSIGVTMFINIRSALLQTISFVNFINYSDNNIYASAKAFANQKQFWTDFKFLFNSDFLKDRRGGLRLDINEADIANAARKNGAKGVIAKVLQAGFLPTQMADSFAIALGGGSFYRNRINTYLKRGLSQKEAEQKAFNDFRSLAEESQQSSRPDKISMEQSGAAGRLILAYANTPQQYYRIKVKLIRDIVNKRRIQGLTLGQSRAVQLSKITYYLAIQNVIFNAMQQALFALLFEEDDEEKEKYVSVANGMTDSVLRGMGFRGAFIATAKNIVMKYMEEKAKESDGNWKTNPNYLAAAEKLLTLSPPVDSKYKKVKQFFALLQYEKDKIETEGFSLENPAFMMAALAVSFFFNAPANRVLLKLDNITTAFDDELKFWQRVSLLAGYPAYQIVPDENEEKSPKMQIKITRPTKKIKIKKIK